MNALSSSPVVVVIASSSWLYQPVCATVLHCVYSMITPSSSGQICMKCGNKAICIARVKDPFCR